MPNTDLTYQVIGCAMEVHNELGPGLREKPYENALSYELRLNDFHAEQQRAFPIRYKEHIVGDCFSDIVVNGELIVETKSIDAISDNDIAKLLNYLRISKLRLGLILNFKPSKLEIKRVAR